MGSRCYELEAEVLMDPSEQKQQAPTISDILAEGEAMASTITHSGTIIRGVAEVAYGPSAIECRKIALGLLAVCVSYLSDETGESELERGLAYYHACMAAFVQGAGVSENLISEAQYVKAAAALKQDYELLTRIHEVEAGFAVEGRQPNIRNAPAGSQRHYGELNKVAHPSNLDALTSVISLPSGGLSIMPVFVRPTAIGLYKLHLWMCCEMVRLVLNLLAALGCENAGILACVEQYELLQERVSCYLIENASQGSPEQVQYTKQ